MQFFYSPYLGFLQKTLGSMPGVTERLCFDTPAFYVADKLFARMKEDGETLVLYTEEREKWMEADAKTFYITDHYRNYKYMLVNLESIDPELLRELLIEAWRKRATKKLLKEWDAQEK